MAASGQSPGVYAHSLVSAANRTSGVGGHDRSRRARLQRREVVQTVVDECFERRLVDWAASPRVDADVDHAAALAPAFVDVAVEQPLALVCRPLLDEPVVIVAVAAIREVAREDSMVANHDVCLSLKDLDEPGGEVPLGPTF